MRNKFLFISYSVYGIFVIVAEMIKTITDPQLCENFGIMVMFIEKFKVVRQMHNVKIII